MGFFLETKSSVKSSLYEPRKWWLENLQCKYSGKGQNVASGYLNLDLSASFRNTVRGMRKRGPGTLQTSDKSLPK